MSSFPDPALTELILYACPVGTLADQLDVYFAESRRQFGANTAHHYMPHCTLTGFFHDRPAAIGSYLSELNNLLPPIAPTPAAPVITITQMCLASGFHRLELESSWLLQMVGEFFRTAGLLRPSSTRPDLIRPKKLLHLSLAYEYPPEQEAGLRALAEALIDPGASVGWVVRFYEHHPDNQWTCHAEWPLSSPDI